MMGFGLIGFCLERAKVPLGPFCIGFILAPIAEEQLRSGLMLSGDSFLPLVTRPISATFLAASIAFLAWPLLQRVADEAEGPAGLVFQRLGNWFAPMDRRSLEKANDQDHANRSPPVHLRQQGHERRPALHAGRHPDDRHLRVADHDGRRPGRRVLPGLRRQGRDHGAGDHAGAVADRPRPLPARAALRRHEARPAAARLPRLRPDRHLPVGHGGKGLQHLTQQAAGRLPHAGPDLSEQRHGRQQRRARLARGLRRLRRAVLRHGISRLQDPRLERRQRQARGGQRAEHGEAGGRTA